MRWNIRRRSLAVGLLLAAGWVPGQEAADAPDAVSTDSRDRIFYPGDSERWKPLAGKLFRNTLLDQKEIWTSPFHMRRQDVKWWAGVAGVTAVLIATDRHTTNVFENSQGQVSWWNNISRIGASYTLLPVVAGFYTYGVLKDDPKPREVGVLGGEALLDSLIVVEVLKTVAGRNRPDNPSNPGHFFKGGDSFPSGHAIESWSLASVIAHEYGRGSKVVPVVVYGLAGVVSAARFGAQRHYASDIVAGGAMGWFLGRYVYQTHMDHSIHKHVAARPRITPELDPTQKLYGLAVAFGD
ncbi:MAG: phosphatase PAP2 family protein [Acidobacteriota bacterium]|nr:phosphatase PAP2 family protein [Acidobacteriota bacterium]